MRSWAASKDLLMEYLLIFIPAGMIFLLYLMIISHFSPELGMSTVAHGASYFDGLLSQNYVNVLSIMLQAILLMSPLFIGLFMLSLFDRKALDGAGFLVIIIAVFVIFYTFFIGASFRAFERFWSPMMPMLAIVCARVIMNLRINKNEAIKIVVLTVLAYALLLVMQLFPGELLPLYPKEAYIWRVFSLQWGFYVPFHSSTAFGFLVKFSTMMAGFIVAAVTLSVYLVLRKSNGAIARFMLLIFIAIGVAYNFILIQEYLASPTSPDINDAAWQLSDYAQSLEAGRPLASYTFFGKYLLKDRDIVFFGYAFADDPKTNSFLAETNRILLIMDYPVIPKDSQFWKTIQSCELEKTFYDKGYPLGYVYDCSKRIN